VDEMTFLLVGDSARILSTADSSGGSFGGARMVPAFVALAARDFLASGISAAGRGSDYVPLAPPTPISYCIDRSRTIVQHADTARDIRKVGARTDTTIFVFVGDTTVKRMAPSPATLGYAMYTTLVGEMHMSVVRRNLASRTSSPSGLPGKSTDGCNSIPTGSPVAEASRRIVATESGQLYRYNGDTIWQERDSSVTRTVFRGDTIWSEASVGNRRRYTMVYVVDGDSARHVSATDSAGATRQVTGAIPARMAAMSRDMLERELRLLPTRERMRQRGGGTVVPTSPATPVTYCIDGSRKIVQHADTARDIRVVGSRTDTTIYQFRGDTTLVRLSPSPRVFGHAMHTTLRGEMYSSLIRRNMASRASPAVAGLPGPQTPPPPSTTGMCRD
jgi:hypothetical protein